MAEMSMESPATIIGPDTFIRGEVTFARPASIMGRIEGHVAAQDALEIAESGVIIGDVTGTVVDIQGHVEGNVIAQAAVRLGPTARLHGELRSANLAISEGATFVGKVVVGVEEPAEAAPAPQHEVPQAAALAPTAHVPAEAPAAEPIAARITVAEHLEVTPAPAPAAAAGPTVRVITQTLQQAQAAGAMRQGKVIKAR